MDLILFIIISVLSFVSAYLYKRIKIIEEQIQLRDEIRIKDMQNIWGVLVREEARKCCENDKPKELLLD